MTFQLLHSAPPCTPPARHYAGERATLDAHWLIPVRVVEVLTRGDGHIAVSGELRVQVLVTTGAYTEGEVVRASADKVVPPKQFRKREYSMLVNTAYSWERGSKPD